MGRDLDLPTILTERILTKNESLFEEPLQLIRGEDEIREPGNYYSTAQEFAGASEIGAYWTRTHDVEIDVVARTKRGYSAVGSCMDGEG